MLTSTLPLSVLAVLDATTAYWVCLIVGGGLLLISALAGGDTDADLDVDTGGIDADFDADVAAEAGGDFSGDIEAHHATDIPYASALASWFSLRFVVFFAAVFGAVGVVLTHLTEIGRGLVLGIALAAGFALGQAVQHLFLQLRRSSGNSTTRPQDYVNKLARVTIAVSGPKKGQVSLQVRDARRFVPAVAKQDAAAFEIGAEVVVVGYRAGIAEVISRDEYEVLTRKESGDQS